MEWRDILEGDRSFRARSFCWNLGQTAPGWTSLLARAWIDTGSGESRCAVLPGSKGERMYFEVSAQRVNGVVSRQMRVMERVLTDARRTCRAAGSEFLVALVPVKFRVYGELVTPLEGSDVGTWSLRDLPGELAAWAGESGVPFLDLTPALRKAAGAGRLVYFLDDSHWTPEGHDLVADEVSSELRRRGWLPGREDGR
jgi:hypothetical protein